MAIVHSMKDLVGNTPLLDASRLARACGLSCRLLLKLEKQNPAGSAKDRVALKMIEQAESEGKLRPGTTIIEPTSGNTGIGLAAVAALCGYDLILTMPDSMSVERRSLLSAYGAKIVLTPAADGMAGAVKKAQELAVEYAPAFLPDQFGNPANPAAHYETTGPEIWNDTAGDLAVFVAGIGTGGTVSGTGKYLKEQNPAVKVIGAEPADSPVLTEGRAGSHQLQGMGANFVPDTLNRDVLDEILTVTTDEAYAMGRLLVKTEGVLCGISSGAAIAAAVNVGSRPAYAGKTVVALLPDTGDRYLSVENYLV